MEITLNDINNIAVSINNALYDINLRDLNQDFGNSIIVEIKLNEKDFNNIDKILNQELKQYDKNEKCNDMNLNIHNINFHIINKDNNK